VYWLFKVNTHSPPDSAFIEALAKPGDVTKTTEDFVNGILKKKGCYKS